MPDRTGETLPVSGTYSDEQKWAINVLRKVLRATRDMLKPGVSGKEIDVPGREIFKEEGLLQHFPAAANHRRQKPMSSYQVPFHNPPITLRTGKESKLFPHGLSAG